MELLNVSLARSVWLFDMRDLNPYGKHIESMLIEWLNHRYHFSKFPSSIYDLDQDGGLAFAMGSFQAKEDPLLSVSLRIYNDGLVGETRSSTRDTDSFIEDVLQSAVQDCGLIYAPTMIRQKFYVSELHARSNHSLNHLNPKIEAFAQRLALLRGGETPLGFSLSSLNFSPEVSTPMITSFLFERQPNTTPAEHRFFSRAPLQTEDHIALLNEFEELLVG